MKRLSYILRKISLPALSKRGKFVLCVLLLSSGIFFSEYISGRVVILIGLFLASLTVFLLYMVLRSDLEKKSYLSPIFILPFLYTLSFALFYVLVPSRLLTRIVVTAVYAFGIYSLFLTQNIFAISTLRTINLLRSARIVSFVITIFVLFFLLNIVFSLRLPLFLTPVLVFILSWLMSAQFLWSYAESKDSNSSVFTFSFVIAFMMGQLAVILSIWPVTAAIYAIFLTGMFYTYSGLSHAWMERRLFRGVLWEYVWVGFLSILFLLVFSRWGA